MATISPISPFRAFDGNGDPLTGGKLYTYDAGTTTPKDTYTDSTEAIAHSNPVILNSTGYAGSDATPLGVWLGAGGYKFVLKTSADVTLWTIDNVGGEISSAFGGQSYDNNTNLSVTSVYANAVINQTAAGTLSLLPVATAGEGFYFIVRKSTSSTVTIDPNASETINGAATLALTGDAIIYCDGTKWLSLLMDTVGAASNNTFSGNNTFTGTNTFSNNVTFTGDILTPSDGTLTIASGVISTTGAYHLVDTEGAAASDELDTINNVAEGQTLKLRTANSARDVIITNAGNIVTPQGQKIVLSSTSQPITLQYDSTLAKWMVLSSAVPIAMTKQYLLSGSSATYTTPNGCTAILVKAWGGGGGGSAQSTNAGSNGTATSFNSVNANPGSGAPVPTASKGQTGGLGGSGGTGTATFRMRGANGQPTTSSATGAAGGNGGATSLGGNGYGLLDSAGQAAVGNSGSGGGGAAASANGSGPGGGAGEYFELYIANPSASYTYTIGGGGNGGAAGGLAGGNGGSGLIIVEEYYS